MTSLSFSSSFCPLAPTTSARSQAIVFPYSEMAKEEHEDTVDVAESFVTAFYHDSDDEVVTE